MMHHIRVEAEVSDRHVNGGGGVHESRDAAELSGVRSRLASLRISSSSPDDNVVVFASSSNAAAGPGLHHNQQQQQQQRLSSYGMEEEFVEHAHKTIKKISSNDHSNHSISDGEILGTYLRHRLEKKQQEQQHTSYGEEPEEQEQEQAQHSNVGARKMRSSSNGNGAAAVAPQRHLSSSTLLGLEKLSKSGAGLVIHERTERRNGSRQKRNNSGNNNGGDLKTTLQQQQQQREERKLHSARPPGELLSAGVRQSVQEVAERSSRRSRQQQQILINSSLRILDHDGDVSSSEQLQQHKQIHSSGIHQGDHEKHDDNDRNSGSEGERGLIYERNHHYKNHHHQQQQQQQASNEGVYHQPRQTPPQTQMLQNYESSRNSRHEIEEKDSSSSSSGGHGDHHHSMPAELHSSKKFLRRESKNQSWFAATELQSNLLVEVADSHFYLHKFPLLSRSGRLNRLVFESRDTNKYHIKLDGMPGGAEAFELAAKFCYGMEIELTPYNVATLRCGAEYLEMTNSLEDGNLVSKTEHYLNFVVLASWKDSITVLQRCQSLSPWAEDLQITRRCSEAIAWKACTDPHGTTTHWSFSSSNDGTGNNSSSTRAANWDGIKNNNNNNNDSSNTTTVVGKHIPHDWWIEDVVCNLDLFETFSIVMTAIKAKGMAYTLVGAAISQYAYKWLPGLARKPKRKGGGGGGESFTTATDHHHNTAAVDVTHPQHNSGNNNNISQNHITTGKEIVLVHHDEDHQHTRHMRLITQMQQDAARQLVEGIVRMLPPQQDAVSCNFLLQLLQFACQLDVGLTCRTELERRIGWQLEQASVHDLLIPSSSSSSSSSSPTHNNTTSTQGYSYDIDIVQRIFNHFLLKEQTGLRNNSPTRSNIVGVEKNSHVFEGGGGSLVPNKLPPTTPHTTKTRVAKLMNSYLAEVARDPNLPLAKFQALAGSLPKLPYASDDGLYRAIDTYLKMHPTMTEHERKKLCRVMDCQRLSLDACLHAAQNERLPLRVVVQVLFSEQVKLRNAITGNSSLERKTQHHHHHIDVGSPSVHEPSSSQAGSNSHILIPRLDGLNMGRVSLEESWQSARSEIKALHHEIATLKSKFSELEHEHYTGMSQQMEKPKKLRNLSTSGGWTSGWRILSSHIKAAPVASNTTSKQGSGHLSRDDYSSAPTFVAPTFTGHNSSATTTTSAAIERRRSHSIASTVSAKGWRNSIS